MGACLCVCVCVHVCVIRHDPIMCMCACLCVCVCGVKNQREFVEIARKEKLKSLEAYVDVSNEKFLGICACIGVAIALASEGSPTMAHTYRVCMVYDHNTVCFLYKGILYLAVEC